MTPRTHSTSAVFVAGYVALGIVAAFVLLLNARDAARQRASFAERAKVNARLVAGAAQSAVVFGDAAAAEQAFTGLLAEPELLYVRILDTTGRPLAEHTTATEDVISMPVLAPHEIELDGRSVHVAHFVRSLSGDVVGIVRVGLIDRTSLVTRHMASAISMGILALLLAAWIVVQRSTTARLVMREQLVHSERLASIGRLSASVAHEINNPLSFIRSNTSFLTSSLDAIAAGDRELLAEVKEALSDTMDGIERIRRIVLDLKSYGRDDKEALTIADLRAIAHRAVKMTGNEVRQRAELVVSLSDGIPNVRVDEGRMVQVLVNLLMNATQALPVSAEPHRIELRVFSRGNEVVAEVADTGTGIRDEVASKLFEPFFTTKPQGQGMGLGLYLCHSIVQACGGTISVANNRDRGCTFRIVLPAAPECATRKTASVEAGLTGPRMRVLVVDDEVAVVTALHRDLGVIHEVVGVTSGAEALELLAKDSRFDVVLCDLMMPGVNGPGVFEGAKRLVPGFEQRFVFITGGAFTDEAAEFLRRVPNRRVDKPLELQALNDAIHHVTCGQSNPGEVKTSTASKENPCALII